MPLSLPHFSRSYGCPRHKAHGKPSLRAGLTLIELLVVLALLSITIALVAPAFVGKRAEEPTLLDVLAVARANAIARAQTLELMVLTSGSWSLRALPPHDSLVVQEGALRVGPELDLVIRVTAVGGCIARSPMPDVLSGLDAAACRVVKQVEAP